MEEELLEMTWRLVKKKGVFKGKHLGKNYGNGESAGAIGRHREQKLTGRMGKYSLLGEIQQPTCGQGVDGRGGHVLPIRPPWRQVSPATIVQQGWTWSGGERGLH